MFTVRIQELGIRVRVNTQRDLPNRTPDASHNDANGAYCKKMRIYSKPINVKKPQRKRSESLCDSVLFILYTSNLAIVYAGIM